MTSYKKIIKTIAKMEERLCIDNPYSILGDIFQMTKPILVQERERNRILCKKHRENNREKYNERHRIWQREYYKKKKKQRI